MTFSHFIRFINRKFITMLHEDASGPLLMISPRFIRLSPDRISLRWLPDPAHLPGLLPYSQMILLVAFPMAGWIAPFPSPCKTSDFPDTCILYPHGSIPASIQADFDRLPFRPEDHHLHYSCSSSSYPQTPPVRQTARKIRSKFRLPPCLAPLNHSNMRLMHAYAPIINNGFTFACVCFL